MIKVFLSHQSADSVIATQIARRLENVHGIATYLDVIDPYMNRRGEDLAAHIRYEMARCTQLLAIVSESTKASQWVPWEIGVATEKSFPLATYLAGYAAPPEFLRKWPYLRTEAEIDLYARTSRAAERSYVNKRGGTFTDTAARASSTGEFFSTLRAGLGQ